MQKKAKGKRNRFTDKNCTKLLQKLSSSIKANSFRFFVWRKNPTGLIYDKAKEKWMLGKKFGAVDVVGHSINRWTEDWEKSVWEERMSEEKHRTVKPKSRTTRRRSNYFFHQFFHLVTHSVCSAERPRFMTFELDRGTLLLTFPSPGSKRRHVFEWTSNILK